jgi:hypothetical protein
MLHPHLEVFPHRAGIDTGKITGGFIIEPHLIVRFERSDDCRHENRVVIRFRHASFADEDEDVVGKKFSNVLS